MAVFATHCAWEATYEVVQRHHIKIYWASFFFKSCKIYSLLTYVKITVKKLLQTIRRKTIRSYLAEGGGIQHFQIELKFWHYTTNKFDVRRTDINIWNSLIILLWKEFIFLHCSLKLQKENRISGLQKGKFIRPSSSPEGRKERSCQSYSASHIKWRAERLFVSPPNLYPPW